MIPSAVVKSTLRSSMVRMGWADRKRSPGTGRRL